MARSAEVEAYLADAQRWEQDLVARAESSKRRAYWVTSAFGALTALTLLAFVAMLPLKSVEPFVIRVDNTTGITDVVPVYAGKSEASEVVTRYLLHNYVVTRERYFYAMAEEDYNLVGAYNSPVLNSLWMQAWDRANSQSPLVLYKDGTTVRSQVSSVSFFTRANGETISAPNFKPDTRPINGTKVEPWPGAPIEPTGNPLLAGVGPGAYAERADHVEQTFDGRDLIVPIRVASNFAVPSESVSPLGFEVAGADGQVAGVVKDLWVDRGEVVLRYYEIALKGGVNTALLPVPFAKVDFKAKRINVLALLGDQFSDIPGLRNADRVTLLEEEKITAYYGAGTLYATPERADPLL